MDASRDKLQPIIKLPVNANFFVRTLGHVKYNCKWKHFPRRIDEYILYFVESGDLYIEEDGIPYHVRKNEALLLEPNKLHVGFQSAVVSYYYIHFSCSERLDCLLSSADLLGRIQALRSDLLNANWASMWEYRESDSKDLFFPKHCKLGVSYEYFQSLAKVDRVFFEGLEGRRKFASLRLAEILIMFCRDYANECTNPNSPRIHILVHRLQLYLNDNYAHPITSQTIESLFKLNYDYLNRKFKAQIGQPIHDYLLSIRIAQAQRLIESGSTISSAAQAVGIEDVAYFSKLFKKISGMAPTEYAKKKNHPTPDWN